MENERVVLYDATSEVCGGVKCGSVVLIHVLKDLPFFQQVPNFCFDFSCVYIINCEPEPVSCLLSITFLWAESLSLSLPLHLSLLVLNQLHVLYFIFLCHHSCSLCLLSIKRL